MQRGLLDKVIFVRTKARAVISSYKFSLRKRNREMPDGLKISPNFVIDPSANFAGEVPFAPSCTGFHGDTSGNVCSRITAEFS